MPELERAFVRDIARTHLPHLYHALQLIAGRLGIDLEDQPPVRFTDLYDSGRRRPRRPCTEPWLER